MTRPQRDRVRILHVEDSTDDAELIAHQIKASGLKAEILRIETAGQLSAALIEFQPELVLSDFTLPTLTALRALEIVREASTDLPFLCVSGTIGEERAVELLKLGATDYVLKSKPERIVPSLLRALRETRDRQERLEAEEQLRQSREQLAQAQKMEAVGRLAGGVAHDFNNILTTISGCCELMRLSLPADSPQRADIEEIMAASDRAAKLTRQLLAFGRKQVFEIRVLEINEIVRGVASMLRRLIGENVRLELVLSPETRRIRADLGQIEQVLMNLAINARDAMPGGGLLRVATCPAGEWTELIMTDTGTGMTPEIQSHIFEPFFTTKEQGHGTGLGLATVYGIIQQSGGGIAVESTPGAGTRFTIRLPATNAKAAPPRPQPTPSVAGGHEAVLVVEDETTLRSIIRRVLQKRGYRVVEAADAAAALRKLEAGLTFDIAVVDVVMPGMGGPALVTRLRARLPALPAIFISGYTDQALLPLAEDGRTFPFLSKPFTSEALLTKLREVLDEKL